MSNYGLIVAAGSVGIGTTTPVSGLELYNSAASDRIFTITSATATNDPLVKFRTGTTPAVQFSLGVDTSDSNAFKIDSNDGLTTSPDFKIDSTGQTTIPNVVLGAQSFPEDAGILSWTDMSVTSSSADNTVMSYSAQIDSNPILTVYALSDGAGSVDNKGVGIGTTAPAYMLDVYDDTATDYAARFFNDGNNTNRYGVVIQAGADNCSTTGTCNYLDFLDGDGTASGGVRIVTGTVGVYSPSDRRLKTDISDTAVNGLDIINRLRVTDFRRNSGGSVGPLQTGFIAQEAQEVFPQMVSPSPDGYLAISDGLLIPVLVKAIQEEHGIVAGLQGTDTGIQASIASQSATVGTLALQTNQQATTLASLQSSVDEQLTVISETENGFEVRLANLEEKAADATALSLRVTTLESAVSLLQSSNQVLLDFYNSLSLGSVLVKDADGNLDLSNGKIRANELSTGALAIEIVDEEAPTIGSATLFPKAVDKKGAKDADGNDVPDGIDDISGESMSDASVAARDGKSITVKTKAVSSGSRIFLTPKQATAEPLAVTDSVEGVGFTVEMKNETSEEIPFDWIVVEEK